MPRPGQGVLGDGESEGSEANLQSEAQANQRWPLQSATRQTFGEALQPRRRNPPESRQLGNDRRGTAEVIRVGMERNGLLRDRGKSHVVLPPGR